MTKKPQPLRSMPGPDDLLSAAELAALLRVSRWTLTHWRRHGEGPSYIQIKRYGVVFYRRSDVHRWLEFFRTEIEPPRPRRSNRAERA
jgi:predicted DNA-binding transcriptional regulator AlpA